MLLFCVWALLALNPGPGKAIWDSFFSQYVPKCRWLVSKSIRSTEWGKNILFICLDPWERFLFLDH